MRCWKIVTWSKQQAALSKLFSLPPPDKTLLPLWNKNFLKEIYRNIQAFAFKVLQECSSWTSRNGAVQIILLAPNRNMLAETFVKCGRFLAAFRVHIIFSVKWVEVCKMSEIFWEKLYCKMSDLFRKFLLALILSATKSGIKKTLMISTGMCRRL